MKFLPQSLFGRLALILFSGLFLVQLTSTIIQFYDRGQRLFQASGLSSSERIAEIVRILDNASVPERQRLISIINVAPLRVSLNATEWSIEKRPETNWPAEEFRKRLDQQLGENFSFRVAVSDQPTVENNKRMHGAGAGTHDMQHMKGTGMSLPDALVFYAQVKLSDGTWVSFENSIAEEVFSDSSVLLLTLALLIVTVLFISLLAVRWVTKPLTMLTQAANKLGGDINQPPLSELGATEVKQAAKAFNSMQSRLQNFIEDRARLLTAISHDLKTPITRMRLRAEMLDDESQRDSFIKNLDEMQSIATETLDFLRADDSREKFQSIDVCALLEAISEDFSELGQHVKLVDCDTKSCRARPMALKRCITNLVENATKYASEVQLSVQEDNQSIKVLVSDLGPGIPEDKLEKVFDPFFRLETSRNRETGGTGLGLSIARNIALSHGGDLHLENKPEGGLQATLTLHY